MSFWCTGQRTLPLSRIMREKNHKLLVLISINWQNHYYENGCTWGVWNLALSSIRDQCLLLNLSSQRLGSVSSYILVTISMTIRFDRINTDQIWLENTSLIRFGWIDCWCLVWLPSHWVDEQFAMMSRLWWVRVIGTLISGDQINARVDGQIMLNSATWRFLCCSNWPPHRLVLFRERCGWRWKQQKHRSASLWPCWNYVFRPIWKTLWISSSSNICNYDNQKYDIYVLNDPFKGYVSFPFKISL